MPCSACERVPSCEVCDGCFPSIDSRTGEDRNNCRHKCRCVACGNCLGDGRLDVRADDGKGEVVMQVDCPVCYGAGLVRAPK